MSAEFIQVKSEIPHDLLNYYKTEKDSLKPSIWKKKYEKIYHIYNNEEEVFPIMLEIRNLLVLINTTQEHKQIFPDMQVYKFFFEDFFYNTAKYLIEQKTFRSNEQQELSDQILQQIMLLFLKTFDENILKMSETMTLIFSANKQYYKLNSQAQSGNMSVLYDWQASQQHLQWAQNIKEGDEIDVIKTDTKNRRICWSRGTVTNNQQQAYIQVTFKNERNNLTKWIQVNSWEIAPLGSKCKDWDWRMNLKVGDIIDACDTQSIWYNSTVLEICEEQDMNGLYREITIGYRVYDENGDKTDNNNMKYNGWSSKFDETLSMSSPRIAMYNTFAKKLFITSAYNSSEETVDDSNDHFLVLENKFTYGIIRQNLQKSIFLMNLINEFGEKGGFDKILNRISDANWCPIELTSFFIQIIGGVQAMLHRVFAIQYVPKIKEALWNNLLNSPDSNIRNFTKERLDNIYEYIGEMLKRVYSILQKRELLDNLKFDLALICFNSEFLERKLQGIRNLQDYLRSSKYQSNTFTITQQELIERLDQAGVFQKLYSSQNYHLIYRSAEFLKIIINEELLSNQNLELIWSGTEKNDLEQKLAIYKLLSDVSLSFKKEHIQFFVQKITSMDPNLIIKDDIELIHELTKFSSSSADNQNFQEISAQFFWKLICDSQKVSNDIIETAVKKFTDIMKSYDMKQSRLKVLNDCANNIQQGTSVLSSMKIIQKIIDSLQFQPTNLDPLSQSSVAENLFKDMKIVELVIQNIKQFKCKIKDQLQNQEFSEQILDSLQENKLGYVDSIQQRIDFLNFIYSYLPKEIELTIDVITQLWNELVKSSLISKEKDIVYKWFQKISTSNSQLAIKLEDLIQFFNSHMCDSNDIVTMTEEGFNCFKSVFCIINEKQKNIKKIKQEKDATQYYSSNSYQQVYRVSYSYDNDSNNNTDFEYFIMKDPENLDGSQLLWEIIRNNNVSKVIEDALDFQNKLYNNFHDELKEKELEFRKLYLKKSYNLLQEAVTNNESAQKQLRCIRVLSSILGESEKKGNGGLKSLTSLIKGEMLSFNFTNDNFYGQNILKKFTIKVYTNSTVFDLLNLVAKQLKTTWDEVKLVIDRENLEIKPKENGKSIAEIRLKNGEHMTVYKRETPPIQKAELILENSELNPKVEKIFKDWFKIYSVDNKMTPEHVGNFIHSCTGDMCKSDDQRVKQVFQKWDTDNDGILLEENFLQFYLNACKERDSVVWSNLQGHHYRKDLKRYDEVEVEQVDVKSLPRYILSKDENFYKLAFTLLEQKGAVANETWKLVSRLPISPGIYSRIVSLEDVRNQENKQWINILNPQSLFTLLYSLHVIEYLMDEQYDEEGEEKSAMHEMLDSTELIAEQKKTWRKDFIQMGGFDHLYKIFVDLSNQDILSLDIFNKNILSFILKIFQNYLVAAFQVKNPYMHSSVERIKLFHIPLHIIVKNINEQDKQMDESNLNDNMEVRRLYSYDITMNKNYSGIKNKDFSKIEENKDFIALVESLQKEGLTGRILSKFEFTSFFKMLFNLTFDVLTQKKELESEDRFILEFSIVLMAAIMMYDVQYFNMFCDELACENLIEQGIFCSRSQNIRKIFNHSLFILCQESLRQQTTVPLEKILKLLLKVIPNSNDQNRNNCSQYFELVCSLTDLAFHHQYIKDTNTTFLDFRKLLEQVVTSLKNHNSNEVRSSTSTDKILLGLLNVCDIILKVRTDLKQDIGQKSNFNLVYEIFSKCLFDINSSDDIDDNIDVNQYDKQFVKCKSEESRKAAYRLLYTLCENCPQNLQILIEMGFTPLLNKIPVVQQYNYSPGSDAKSQLGYLGIKNIGCICYMIAMIQQFFMTPTLRHAILMAEDDKDENIVQRDIKGPVDDNVLHQFQKMFGFMEQSDRVDYNPTDFCFSFKYAGEPVNVSIQQDAQEFLNMIFDKLEFSIKNTPFKYILDGIYGGKICSQLICQQCGKVKNRIENFYNLSLEVKNLKSVYESFQKFITGEIISDYQCDNCNKKVDTKKRVCLANLPNVLIIHLQRIIFDLDLLQNSKINSKLEFPMDLDLEPYTLEGLEWREKKDKREEDFEKLGPYQCNEQNYYEYKLVGVVVHSGAAEYGHYYSYIDTKRDPESIGKYFDDKEEVWLEYNDSRIKEFKTKNIQSECFGGTSGNDSNDDMFGWNRRDNSKNAYMLVYERRVKTPLKLVFDSDDQLKQTMAKCKIEYNLETQLEKKEKKQPLENQDEEEVEKNQDEGKLVLLIPYYNFKKYLPTKVFRQVWEDNQRFMFEKNLYNEEFFKFMKDITSAITLPVLTSENCSKGYYNEYEKLPLENRQTYRRMIDLLHKVIFDLLLKAYDNIRNTMTDSLFSKLTNLMYLCPDYIYEFLNNFALDKQSKIMDTLISCSDKLPRQVVSNMLALSINLVVNYEGLSLDMDRLAQKQQEFIDNRVEPDEKFKKEQKIIEFLLYNISLLPSEVAKNWLRFQQYFEFWQQFSSYGMPQILFLYQNDFISIQADFFLQKSSPINQNKERKHQIGNRFTNPAFDPLLESIYNMVYRSARSNSFADSDICFTISHQAKKCLYNFEFWHKCFNEGYKISTVGKIIEIMSYENELFSEIISGVIIKNLYKCHYDDVKPLLEVIVYFLHICDSLTQKRLEWVLGVPELLKQSFVNRMSHFGSFGIQTLDDQVFSFVSPLRIENSTSLMEKIVSNRKRSDNISALCLKYLIKLCEISEAVSTYIFYLPPPTYLQAKFQDFIRPFAESYLADAKKFSYWSFPKEEVARELLSLLQQFETSQNNKLNLASKWQQTFYEDLLKDPYIDAENVIRGVFKPYIIGQTIKQTLLNQKIYNIPIQEEQNQFYKSDNQLIVQQYESTCFYANSQPTGIFNNTFSKELFKELYLQSMQVEQFSPQSCFFQKGIVQYGYYDSKSQGGLWSWEEYQQQKEQNLNDEKIQDQDEQESDDINGGRSDNDNGLKSQPKYPHKFNNCVRYFVMNNNSQENLHVRLVFKFEQRQNELLNIPLITSPISILLKPLQQQIVVHTFQKIVPEIEWPVYDYEFECSVVKFNKFAQWPTHFQTKITQEEAELISSE